MVFSHCSLLYANHPSEQIHWEGIYYASFLQW